MKQINFLFIALEGSINKSTLSAGSIILDTEINYVVIDNLLRII